MSNYRGGGGGRERRAQATSDQARTPIAWQHRDINYHQRGYADRYRTEPARGSGGPPSVSDRTSHTDRSSHTKRSARESELSAAGYRERGGARSADTSSTSSESSRDTKVPAHAEHGGAGMQLVSAGPPTVRSAQSVPMLLAPAGGPVSMTWDGEPCPVHHMPPPLSMPPLMGPPRAASLYDLRVGTPHSLYEPPRPPPYPHQFHPGVMTVDRKPPPPPPSSLGGRPIPPAMLLPPLMRPRPIVLAENGAPRELPMRDPKKPALMPPSGQQKQPVGCGGLKKVLLISAAVIVLGVILAVALTFIIN